MKKIASILFVLVFLLPVSSYAEHHRGHSVMQLDVAIQYLGYTLAIAERNRDNPATPEKAAFHLNKYIIYAGKYRDRILAARELLVSGGDLEDIRRLVSAPGMGGQLESADYGLAATVSILGAATREGADSYQMSAILTRHSKAAQFLGWGHWHVIDAIREEVYKDPTFICSGPNNHCE